MKKQYILYICILLILIFTQCSIFDGLYPDKAVGNESAQDLITLGDTALQNGNIDGALDYYSRAITASQGTSGLARKGYAKAYILKNNADLMFLGSQLSAGTGLPSSIVSSLTNTMNTVINTLNPIGLGQCDSSVATTDFEVNVNLLLAFFIRGFMKPADSNGDGNYFAEGDILIFKNGSITYNENVVDIDTLQAELESSLQSVQDSLNALPSLIALDRSVISNTLQWSHNITEDLLLIYKIFGNSFSDFTKAMDALNRGITGLNVNNVLNDIKTEADKRYNEMNSYLNGSLADTTNLNNNHYRIVGQNMINFAHIDHWYDNFIKSDWTTHVINQNTYIDNGITFTNLNYKFSQNTGNFFTNNSTPTTFNEDLLFMQQLTNTLNKLIHDVENGNLLKNLMGS